MLLRNLGRLWRVLRRDPASGEDLQAFRSTAIRVLAWLAVYELLILADTYPLKLLIDALSGSPLPYGLTLGQYAGVIAAIVLVVFMVQNYVNMRMENVRNDAYVLSYVIINKFGTSKQLSLGMDWHTAHSTGQKESSLSKNHKKVQMMFDNLLFDVVPLSIRLPIIAVALWILDWRFGLLATLTSAVYLAMMVRNERHFGPMREDFRRHTSGIERSDTELSATAIDIRHHGLELDMAEAHHELLSEHKRTEYARTRQFRWRLWQQDQSLVFSQVGLIAVAYWSYVGGLSVGGVALGTALMGRIYGNIWRYGMFQWILNESSQALKELVELFELEPTIKTPEQPAWPQPPRGRIVIDNVSFRYPGADQDALSDVSLTVEPGTTVALVGPSGGGKSTLARLVSHQYDPTAGSILVDGVNLRDIDDLQYRRVMLGTVPQEPGLFDRSIERNIGMVVPDATAEAVRQAAEDASAAEFIAKLPQGYDTLVGERGVNLSGGQRQRVALARALLRRPPILVLDEPTSALDAVRQLEVKQTLEQLAAGRSSTILIIAHRFSTIEMADVVVVMEQGRIAEIGTHEQLRRKNGLYQRLRSLEGLLD